MRQLRVKRARVERLLAASGAATGASSSRADGNCPLDNKAMAAGDVLVVLKSHKGSFQSNVVMPAQVLSDRSDYFRARLSERWRVDRKDEKLLSLPMEIPKGRDVFIYLRCLEAMKVSEIKDIIACMGFVDVEDALKVLEVVTDLLFNDGITACMCYLEAVPWNPLEVGYIRSSLASLTLVPSPDLAARLCEPNRILNYDPEQVFFDTMSSLLSINLAPNAPQYRLQRLLQILLQYPISGVFRNRLTALLVSRLPPALVDMNGSDSHALSPLARRSLDLLYALNATDEIIELLNGDLAVHARNDVAFFVRVAASILDKVLQSIWLRKSVATKKNRIDLLETWLPVIGMYSKLKYRNYGMKSDHLSRLEEGFKVVVQTLPLQDQGKVFVAWLQSCVEDDLAVDLEYEFYLFCDKLKGLLDPNSLQPQLDCGRTLCPFRTFGKFFDR
ncbi:hypothetical protein O6H91_07G062600 [Diphasiastrum complanatum]|uniref:Uncharacterized protein n=1 Tax=Diphasiastrum complanatum TaxID=34168 RepID=A0ACC2D5W0_DIPCM|nr:hypothetical protein O6H91_07G062600 [Diphasiastrum complanatum]